MGNLNKIPQLRFPEFKAEWEFQRNKDLVSRVSIPVEVEEDVFYKQIGIRSHGKGIFHKEPVTGKSLGNKRVFWIQKDMFIVNIVFAWELAVAKTSEKEEGLIASHRFPMYQPKENTSNVDYLLHYYLTRKGKHLLGLASPGGAGRNKTLGQKEFEKLKYLIPTFEEQSKIANFLSTMDKRIAILRKKKAELEEYKKGVMRKIFKQEIRFKDDDGSNFPEWEEKKLGDVLDYLQPTKFLVSDTDYKDKYTTPVLTAGKKFILGYTDEKEGVFSDNLPTIIFDDFTTAFHFVDFPFKAKSSAMKMLIPRNENLNIRFFYEVMRTINFPLSEHKRYWISEYQNEKIPYPHINEQAKITDFLSSIDNSIDKVSNQVDESLKYKQGLLQKMFV